MSDYQVVKIGNHEHKDHPLLEKAMEVIRTSDFFRKYGDPSKLPFYGIDEYGPIWTHTTNSLGTLIMVHVKCPAKLKSVDDVMKYRETPYYQELSDAAKSLAEYINSQLGMKLAKRSTMSASNDQAMVYINADLLKDENGEKKLNESDIRRMVAEALKKAMNEDEDYNPAWDDYSMDNIKDLYNSGEEEYDDTQAGGDYKADPSDPYFYDDSGRRTEADAIGQFHNDFAIVKKEGKVNFVNSEGKLISKEWFDACNDFEDGLAVVSRDGKRNFIKADGQLLLPMWVNRAGDFIAGRAPIIVNGQRHEVDRNGNIF